MSQKQQHIDKKKRRFFVFFTPLVIFICGNFVIVRIAVPENTAPAVKPQPEPEPAAIPEEKPEENPAPKASDTETAELTPWPKNPWPNP